jgi:uncharacterized membrane protein YeaQ/YmgE (transglycosylase-associated protein family)
LSLLVFLLFLVVGGFLLGALARLAVPGPDPMPLWLTLAIGIGGSIVGGLAEDLLFGRPGSLLHAYFGAVVLVTSSTGDSSRNGESRGPRREHGPRAAGALRR